MDGLIPIDKPSGWTSHDVVLKVRACLGELRVGHFGTLDPLATGLLLIAVGQATRFFPFYSRADKSYRGRLRLGLATDTYDAQGSPAGPECLDLPSGDELRAAMGGFRGAILQAPPVFSAKKIQGQPSYKLARNQKAVPLRPQQVTVHVFSLEEFEPPRAEFFVSCTSGTYIRSLVHDLGILLGCGAHLESLRRLSSGEHRLEQAFGIEDIERMAGRGEHARFLEPLDSLLPGLPALTLSESGFPAAKNGKKLSDADFAAGLPAAGPGIFRLFRPDGKLIALARRDADSSLLHPFLVLP
ncbi:MAG: tRNA pseudouridine(55) synthase TruB [Candidatus Aminicenantes bacterium RBG_13_63_10]|nr:MAG: tRNA pseudouridine(55) synthase TruB [Candidatus Aminicenantes bacterium RBG_13_63_10]